VDLSLFATGCSRHSERVISANLELARIYLHAWQVTSNEFFRTITEEILDYVIREMTSPPWGLYSTQAADSEGKDGPVSVDLRPVAADVELCPFAAQGLPSAAILMVQTPWRC
jgi:hypothetical protein